MTRLIQIAKRERPTGGAGRRAPPAPARRLATRPMRWPLAALERRKADVNWFVRRRHERGARLRPDLPRRVGMARALLPIDHPEEPARCLVSGTGLTHLGSARDRTGACMPWPQKESDRQHENVSAGPRGRPSGPGRSGTPPNGFTKDRHDSARPQRTTRYSALCGRRRRRGRNCRNLPGRSPTAGRGASAWRCGNEFSDHASKRKIT